MDLQQEADQHRSRIQDQCAHPCVKQALAVGERIPRGGRGTLGAGDEPAALTRTRAAGWTNRAHESCAQIVQAIELPSQKVNCLPRTKTAGWRHVRCGA